MLVVSFLSAMLGKPRLHVFVWIMSICSPWFPGTTGPIDPALVRWTGTRLGYGIVLFLWLWSLWRCWVCCIRDCGKQKQKNTERVSLGERLCLRRITTTSCFFIIFWYIFYTQGGLWLHVFKASQKWRWKHTKRKDKLANVSETRQYLCPVVKYELTSASAAPSANTQTGISNTDTFMSTAVTHVHMHAHTHTGTPSIHWQYT